jgi:hypothetical protein
MFFLQHNSISLTIKVVIMKKLYILLVIALIGFVGNAQIVNIPDANFKTKLLASSPTSDIAFNSIGFRIKIDTNSNGEIEQSEALAVSSLDIANSNITDLTGIEYFINLFMLIAPNNQLTTFTQNGLPNLITLWLQNNNLNSINFSGYSSIRELLLMNNQLSSLSVSNFYNLEQLDCTSNQLIDVDLTGCNRLWQIILSNNQLTSIAIPPFTDNSSTLAMYQGIYLDNNLFENLTSPNYTVVKFSCSNNPNLRNLNLKESSYEDPAATGDNFNMIFPFANCSQLEYVCVRDTDVEVTQNMINNYGYNDCHVNSYCSFTPGGVSYIIQGNNRYDSDNSGCDSNDIGYPNFKCSITNGTNTGTFIANNTGSYSIPVGVGTHSIVPIIENPNYFAVSPVAVTVTFPTTASPFTQNFCIAPNGVKNDLEVTIIPIEVARPGFDAFYKIIYKNKGNQLANGSLSFTFNDAIMDLVSASPVVNTTGTNSLSWNYTNLNPFETREINLTFNINSPMETPAVNGGDVLNYSATIIGATDETPTDNVFSLNQTVVNSFDPNDKTCLEGTTITPSMVGNYVHYVIRFENTGTFAAQNVVIKDMIDTTKFDMASLIPQSSSHPFVTRITNTNQVEFIFENINLPFDDATNDGYVAFKIKTKPTLVLGNTFTNTASIYFDYNFPIITNTTTTTVAALGNQDFDFGSVFTLSPVPAKDVLTISTKTAVVVSSVNIYNALGQLVQVNTNPNETIDVSGLQSGSYFIRMTSDKGSASGKFIKE